MILFNGRPVDLAILQNCSTLTALWNEPTNVWINFSALHVEIAGLKRKEMDMELLALIMAIWFEIPNWNENRKVLKGHLRFVLPQIPSSRRGDPVSVTRFGASDDFPKKSPISFETSAELGTSGNVVPILYRDLAELFNIDTEQWHLFVLDRWKEWQQQSSIRFENSRRRIVFKGKVISNYQDIPVHLSETHFIQSVTDQLRYDRYKYPDDSEPLELDLDVDKVYQPYKLIPWSPPPPIIPRVRTRPTRWQGYGCLSWHKNTDTHLYIDGVNVPYTRGIDIRKTDLANKTRWECRNALLGYFSRRLDHNMARLVGEYFDINDIEN